MVEEKKQPRENDDQAWFETAACKFRKIYSDPYGDVGAYQRLFNQFHNLARVMFSFDNIKVSATFSVGRSKKRQQVLRTKLALQQQPISERCSR